MRQVLVPTLAALLLGSVAASAGPPDVPKGPVAHSQRVMANASANFCSQVGDLWRCRALSANAYAEPTDGYRNTMLRLDQWRSWPNGYQYRWIECPVARQALKVSPNRATIAATLDADSAACSQYGEIVTFDPPSWQPWVFTGLLPVEATLLNPGAQESRVTSYTYRNNETGQSQRDNCHGGAGYRPYGGGFTMLGLYRAFGPADADGSYSYETCGTTVK